MQLSSNPHHPKSSAEETEAPNVVLIMTDSQGVNVLGCYGSPLDTPRLDRLAAEGVRCDRAYTTSPVCSPARSALFTGLYPHANGCWGNQMSLGREVRTLGERLKGAGVHTAYIGKWHLDAFDYFGDGHCPPGWDPEYWYDMRCFLEELPEDERRRSRLWREDPDHPTLPENTFAHRCVSRAERFLERHGGERFFLTVSLDEPHGPHRCPPEYRDRYAGFRYPANPNVYDDLSGKPEHQRAWAASLDMEEVPPEGFESPDYFGCNAFVDDQIGRLLDSIDQHAPGAMVLFTSDHGYLLHAHHLYGKGPVMYDECARIPLLVRWPGRIGAGGVLPGPVSHIDLVPTVLDVMGVRVPEVLHGRSLLPDLLAPDTAEPRPAFMEFNRFNAHGTSMGGLIPIRAVFDGRCKLVLNLFGVDELYDVEEDPQEMRNRIDDPDLADIRDRLHTEILRWMARTCDPFACDGWRERVWAPPCEGSGWKGNGLPEGELIDAGHRPVPIDYTTGMPRTA